MSKTMIDKMVDRFLGWKLPLDFAPDHYISFDRESALQLHKNTNGIVWPIGTNLLTAEQAREMVKHLLADALPADVDRYATEEEGDAYMQGYFDGQNASETKINGG